MDDNTRKMIELATVPVRSKSMKPGEGGQGVYIGNHFVLTAAHCLDFDTNSGNALGGYNIYCRQANRSIVRSDRTWEVG